MKRWIVVASAVVLIAVLVCGGVACSWLSPRDLGEDDLDRAALDPGKGRIIGVVTDNEEFLPEGATPQTYEGASIRVHRAVESGTYKLWGGGPEGILYDVGEMVAEVKSREDGHWQVDLEPGAYFIRAFYGDRSYSGDILIEVKEGEVEHLTLELIHGI